MTQTTSGIEPVFLPVYKRRRKVNPNDASAKVDFVDDLGDAWEEYIVFHHKFVDWMVAQGYPTAKRYTQEEIDAMIEQSPYYKASANDIDWVQKVKMQGRVQKWVDHSISVTINLPGDVDEELVNRLYIEAWKSGCKGCTVYREGSRAGVLISTTGECEPCPEPPVIVAKRPRELEADIVKFQNNKEKWIAFVGLINDRPYEIFTGIADDEMFLIPKSITQGKIIKVKDENGKKRYDFQYEDRFGYSNIVGGLSHMFAPEYWNYAKLISSVLRFGMPIPDVVNLVSSLHLNDENINTWKNGVERALKKYIPDGTVVTKGNLCPDCKSEGTLVYREGCLTCSGCAYSKCE